MRKILERYPAVVVSCLFCAMLSILFLLARRLTGGSFVFPLDDSYIHLAVARSLALHHVWGIDGKTFASASSSPGWTVLLSLSDLLFGEHVLNGLVLNALFGIAVLFAVDYGVRSFVPSASAGLRYFVLVIVLLGTPLPSLTILGMEHVAQTLSILLLVILTVQILTLDPELAVPRWMTVSLLLTAVLAGAIRYEAVFAIAPVCLALLLRRRTVLALLTACCSAVTPVLFGLYSYQKSGLWLPFSVIVKAAHPSAGPLEFVVQSMQRTRHEGFLPVLILLASLWIVRRRQLSFLWPSQLLLFFSFWIILLHLIFAPTGWLMRYEGYLYAVAIFSLLICSAEILRWKGFVEGHRPSWLLMVPIGLLTLIVGHTVAVRAINGVVLPLQMSTDRYFEHIQVARFVASAYDHDTVTVNDIGALAYFTDAHLLDLIGLGSVEPAKAIHNKQPLTAADVDQWAASEHSPIAILQTGWPTVLKMLPPNWIKVAEWTVPRNIQFYDRQVSFFATNPDAVKRICESLQRFPPPPQDKVVISPACNALAGDDGK